MAAGMMPTREDMNNGRANKPIVLSIGNFTS